MVHGHALQRGHVAQVSTGAAARVEPVSVQQGAHRGSGIGQSTERRAIKSRGAGSRILQPHAHAHGGGFAGTIRSEEAGDLAVWDLKGEVIYCFKGTEILGQV